MKVIWHFHWKLGHYVEWHDGERNHLKFMTEEEYDDFMLDLELN